MKKSRFSEQQIAYILKQADDGLSVEWPAPSRCSEPYVRLGGLLCGVHAATL